MRIKSNLVLSAMLLGGATLALSALPALSSAYAQDGKGAALEEIIVTAQKRTQNVRDVAGSVNVITGARIAEYNAFNFIDLERISSGLALTQANPRNVTIALRGITQNPESGTAPAVDVYQNNASQRPDNIFGALYDMSRVEVLRGAQGSVQGATSPAGAIILHTAKADLETLGGYIQATYADTNSGFNGQGALSIPIIRDQLSLRIAGYYDQNDGNNIVNLATGKVQKRDNTSYRASLRWQPTDSFELNLVYQDNDESILGTPALQGTRAGTRAFNNDIIPTTSCVPSAKNSCRTLTANNNTALAASDAFANREAQITTLNLNWTFGKQQLNYVFGKTKSVKASRTELDASNNLPHLNAAFAAIGVITDTNYLTHQNATNTVNDSLHELRLASVDNSFWNYMGGVYYHDQKTSARFDAWTTAARYIPLNRLPPIDHDRNSTTPAVTFTGGHIEGVNFSTGGTIPFEAETTAIFTAHSFQFTDKMKLEAAARYQRINQFRSADIVFGEFNERGSISVQNAMATLGAGGPEAPAALVDAVVPSVLSGTLAGVTARSNIIGVPKEHQSPSPTAITGSVRFKYDVNDSIKSYVSWSRGFRAGGISIAPGAKLMAADLLFNDETSDSFEVGTKLALAGGKAEINIAVYQQIFDGYLGYVTGLKYKDISNPSSPIIEDVKGGIVYNGDATVSGIEVEGRIIIAGNWLLGGSFSYTKAELDNALVPCNDRTATEQLGRCESSARIPGSPDISANLFTEYSRSFGAMRLFVRANGKYNGGIVATRATNDAGTSPGETESFILADLFVGVQTTNIEVSIWAKNLLDDDSLVDLTNAGDDFDIGNNFGIVRRQQERLIGATARYNF